MNLVTNFTHLVNIQYHSDRVAADKDDDNED